MGRSLQGQERHANRTSSYYCEKIAPHLLLLLLLLLLWRWWFLIENFLKCESFPVPLSLVYLSLTDKEIPAFTEPEGYYRVHKSAPQGTP
jgi:hypothetical protein